MKWLVSIALQKAVKNFVKAALVGLAATTPLLEQYGVRIEINEALAIAGLVSLVEFVRNWLKVRWGVKFL